MMQGPGGVSGPSVVSEGATFEVKVSNGTSLRVTDTSTNEVFYVPVKNGQAKVTVPSSSKGGAILVIKVLGSRVRLGMNVEVIAQD